MFPLYRRLLEIDRTVGSRLIGVGRQSTRQSTSQNARQWLISTLFGNRLGLEQPQESTIDLLHVGLGLLEKPGSPEEDGYDWCTPLNCRVFARTGSGGTHFSFLARNGTIDESSPVVVTLPSNLGYSAVLGESLYEFLCLGCLRGFYGLEQIGSDLKSYFNQIDFTPNERDAQYGFESNATKELILEHLRRELRLTPWSNVPDRLAWLEAKYEPLLEFPPDYLE